MVKSDFDKILSVIGNDPNVSYENYALKKDIEIGDTYLIFDMHGKFRRTWIADTEDENGC